MIVSSTAKRLNELVLTRHSLTSCTANVDHIIWLIAASEPKPKTYVSKDHMHMYEILFLFSLGLKLFVFY